MRCQEKIERLKIPDIIKPKKSLLSDSTLGNLTTIILYFDINYFGLTVVSVHTNILKITYNLINFCYIFYK